MALTIEQARDLADRLTEELNRRTPQAERLTDYYRGNHPLKFASREFARHFADRYADFCDNWTAPVADVAVERLTVVGVQPYGAETADVELGRVWLANDLDADSQLGFLSAGIGARAFVLVWGDPADETTPTVTFEDPTQAIVAYRAGSRRDRVAALKRWQDGSTEFCTLYTADEVWKFERTSYRADQEARKSLPLAAVDDLVRQWMPRDTGTEPNPLPNPMGVVPMVELPNRPLLADDPISDVGGVAAMQDAVNYLWALLFNSADFASLPARVVTGADVPKTPILNEHGEIVGEKPVPLEKFALDRVLWIPDENAKISSWPAADLKAYTDVIEVAVGHIAAQTRTPAHYLIGKMANLSGDALIAAEAGLVRRCEEKQLWFGQAIREVARLVALAQGDDRKAQALRAGTVLWADTESRSRAQLADALLKLKQIGFPFEFLARQYGLTPPEVAVLVAMREREAELDPVAQMMAGKPDPATDPTVPGADPAADGGPMDQPRVPTTAAVAQG
ncbi:phage portal protein [Actinomadura gamaensis]|uniref:Phage portal protein n=1 Tax=Actinomadura gamaensis TaxID=1763541 RepID=A0ABV9U9R9_9ACTN